MTQGYIEDPPIPKPEHILKLTAGQIQLSHSAEQDPGPRKKLSQTPSEMLNPGAVSVPLNRCLFGLVAYPLCHP